MMTKTGNPYYRAPEMLLCSFYDNKIDIWGVGVVTYYMLFNEFPFGSTTYN